MTMEPAEYERLLVLREKLIRCGANPNMLHAFSELTRGCAKCHAPLNLEDPYGTSCSPCTWRSLAGGDSARCPTEVAYGERCAACGALIAGMPRTVTVRGARVDGPRCELCEQCRAPFVRILTKIDRAAKPRRKHGGEWPR